jgi:hypothetical protein
VSTTAASELAGCLTGPWLAVSLGVDPRRVDAMRRAGELIAVRRPGSTEWLYPGWQVADGRVLDAVPQIVAAGRAAGLDETALFEALTAPRGLRGGRSLAGLVAAGEGHRVVDALRER